MKADKNTSCPRLNKLTLRHTISIIFNTSFTRFFIHTEMPLVCLAPIRVEMSPNNLVSNIILVPMATYLLVSDKYFFHSFFFLIKRLQFPTVPRRWLWFSTARRTEKMKNSSVMNANKTCNVANFTFHMSMCESA